MRLVTLSLLCAVAVYGQGTQTPIYNGLLQSDLNAAGFKILSANLADYAGTNLTWNVATGKFDATGGGGGGSGTVTSLTATYPIVVAPTPLVTTGVISLHPVQMGIWDQASLDSMKWDGGATGLVAATGRISLGLVIGTNVEAYLGNPSVNGYVLSSTTGGVRSWVAPATGGGSGTVTDFSAGDLSPLFTTTEATTTTTPALSFSLTNAAATTVFGRAAGTSGAPTYSASPQFTAIGNLTTNGFVKTSGGAGTLSVDTSTYLTANQNISLTGDVTGGPSATSIATTIGNNKVTLGMMATMATDSILGRATTSTGNVEVLAALPFAWSGGDVTRAADSNTETIANSAVTYAKMQNVSANNRLLGAGSAGTGLPPAEITVGTGLTMTGTTLTASGGTGTVTSITATSPIVVAPTPLTATGVVSLDKTVDLAMTAAQSITATDAVSAVTDVLVLNHNSTGVGATNFGTGIMFNAEDSTTNNVNIAEITATWTNATHNSNASRMDFKVQTGATNVSTQANLLSTGIFNVVTGFTVTNAAVSGTILQGDGTKFSQTTPTWPITAGVSGKIFQSNGTNFVLSTPTWPTTAGTARTLLVSNGSNWVNSTETWAVPGAATNFLKSDGTNWTAAQPAFSSLTGSATAAQMPAFTGDVTSTAGATANTLVNIPATTTIAGAAGTRGDVLYYGASGWAKLGFGTNGNQLTTHGTGADPTWDAPGTGGGGAVSDGAFPTGWDTDTTNAPSRNAVYDYLHLSDTDDDGKVNVLETVAGLVKTDASGVVSNAVAGTDYQAADADLTSWAAITRASGIDTFVTTPSSANLRAALTDENGTGAALFNAATSPDFTTSVTIGSVAVPTISSTSTLTNKRINPRVTTITSNATLSPNGDTDDVYAVSALAAAITTISAPTGTPVDGQKLIIRVISDSSIRAISGWNAIYRFSTALAAPSTTVASSTHTWGFMYNATAVKWDCIAQAINP